MEDGFDFRDKRNETKKKNNAKLSQVTEQAKANVLDKKEKQREQQRLAEIEKQKELQAKKDKEQEISNFGKRKTKHKKNESDEEP
jgi:hypothetical protein